CSSIPSKSIMEPLETNELAKIIKNDTMFERFYTMVSKTVENLSDIDKAKYTEITYSSFYDCYKFMNDSTQTKPLTKEFETEWNNKYAQYDNKVDSVMDYWKKYIEDNSEGADVIFLTGIGKCFPLFRAHNVLNNLNNIVNNVPVVMFYPGNFNGQYLVLFSKIEDDNHYRAFKLVD
ncbi:MAG: DUF1788 domain-containing protein, partial [Oscillospiraceae bacterium]|nr:DUF1788 domain-containing protein [Oscillospiraceae bacterium]